TSSGRSAPAERYTAKVRPAPGPMPKLRFHPTGRGRSLIDKIPAERTAGRNTGGSHESRLAQMGRETVGDPRPRRARRGRGDAEARRHADLSDPGRRATELRRASGEHLCDRAWWRALLQPPDP